MEGRLVVLLVFVLISSSRVLAQNVDIKLAARNLAKGDLIWGPPDPFVKVSYAIGSNPFNLIGKTATLHTANPNWAEVFNFMYVDHLDQKVKFEVIEADAFVNDPYGSVTLTMAEILNANTLERDFGKGTLIITRVT